MPRSTPAAARAVLDGTVRRLDLLVDDSDGVVLGGLRIPGVPAVPGLASVSPTVWGTCRSLVRTLVRPAPTALAVRALRLRVEADGVLLSDVDTPLESLTVRSVGGTAEVVVHPSATPPRHTTSRRPHGLGPGLPLPRGRPRHGAGPPPDVDGPGGGVGADASPRLTRAPRLTLPRGQALPRG